MEEGSYRPRFSRSLLAPRHWPTWLGLGLYRLLSLLPRRARAALGRRIGDLIHLINARRRHIVMVNLELCFPELDPERRERMARDYFRCLAQSTLDYEVLWWGSGKRLDRMVTVQGMEHLQLCREQGRPVILLTCHTVALDFGAATITRRFATVGMIKPVRNPLIEWFMSRGRTRFRGRLFLRSAGLRPVVRALRRGEMFYYLPDEDLSHVKGGEWIFAPFFGVPTATITALGRLARLTGAAVVPCASWYLAESGGYRVILSPPLEDFPTGDTAADTARMNRELEGMIRQHPEQYMWSLRLFKTRPGGEPSPYS